MLRGKCTRNSSCKEYERIRKKRKIFPLEVYSRDIDLNIMCYGCVVSLCPQLTENTHRNIRDIFIIQPKQIPCLKVHVVLKRNA